MSMAETEKRPKIVRGFTIPSYKSIRRCLQFRLMQGAEAMGYTSATMRIDVSKLFAFTALATVTASLCAQEATKPKPEDTEIWEPAPKVVTPGANNTAPPSDAIVLFDGKNEDEWVYA